MQETAAVTHDWALPLGARQWHIRANPQEARYFTDGKALCGTHYRYWYPPRPGRDDNDARCCPKCRAKLAEASREA